LSDLPEQFIANDFATNPNHQNSITEKNTDWDRKAIIKLNFTSNRCQKIAKKFIRYIKKLTPDFDINFAWKNITLRNLISPRLKKSEPMGSLINCCYLFTCPCTYNNYIGETKKRLSERAKEHQQKSRNTAISQHIKVCEDYKKLSLETIGPNPRPSARIKFHEGMFKPIGSNLGEYHVRKLFEATQIHLFMPKLNEQVKSCELSLI
jgi:hypothetical protein